MKLKSKISAIVLTAVVGLGMAVIPATVASAHYLDGTDPSAASGGYCASDGKVIKTATIRNSAGTRIGDFEVRYSPSCGTNWVRVNNLVPGAIAEKFIGVQGGFSPGSEMDVATGWSYSMQVYAPGSTCIDVAGIIRNGTTHLGAVYFTLC